MHTWASIRSRWEDIGLILFCVFIDRVAAKTCTQVVNCPGTWPKGNLNRNVKHNEEIIKCDRGAGNNNTYLFISIFNK